MVMTHIHAFHLGNLLMKIMNSTDSGLKAFHNKQITTYIVDECFRMLSTLVDFYNTLINDLKCI